MSRARILRALVTAAAVLLATHALIVFAAMPAALWVRQEMTYPEGECGWAARNVAAGLPAYEDWREWPHRFSPYGPLLFYPVGLISRALGYTGFSHAQFAIGRAQSYLALLAIGVLIAMFTRELGCSRWAQVAAVGVFTLWCDLWYLASYRADAPALAFSMLAVYLALRVPRERPGIATIAAAVALAIAWMYKSTFIAPLPVIAIVLWRRSGVRSAIAWTAAFAVLAGGAFLLTNLLTRGMYAHNTMAQAGAPLTPDTWRQLANTALTGNIRRFETVRLLLALVLAFAMVVYARGSRRWVGLYLVAACAAGGALLFRRGSDVNYLVEVHALAAIMIAVALDHQFALRDRYHSFVAALAMTFVLVPMPLHLADTSAAIAGTPNLIRSSNMLSFKRQPSTALLMNLAYDHPDPTTHAMPDPYYYIVMLQQEKLSPDAFRSRLESRAFSLIAMPPEIHAILSHAPGGWFDTVLKTNYEPRRHNQFLELWVPRAPQ